MLHGYRKPMDALEIEAPWLSKIRASTPLNLLDERPPSSHEISSLVEAWQVPPGLGRRGRETWEGQTLLTLPSGSWQVSGPNPIFTDSQEI